MEVGGLISQLRAGSVGQRSAAAERLGELGGRAAVDALAEGLKAEPGSVGSAAALALARIGDDLATERLVDGRAGRGRLGTGWRQPWDSASSRAGMPYTGRPRSTP